MEDNMRIATTVEYLGVPSPYRPPYTRARSVSERAICRQRGIQRHRNLLEALRQQPRPKLPA